MAREYNQRANQTCERTYARLVGRYLSGRTCVLELGSGGSSLLASLGSRTTVACDLSREMLLTRSTEDTSSRVVAAAERLPFEDGRFDGIFSINMLEHVGDLESVLSESARVLTEGGVWLAVTPNGNWERLLDLAERWSLKIPEGPHQFLTTRRLLELVGRYLEVTKHLTMLLVPAGPPGLASWIDRISLCSALEWGFFQCIVARKRPGGRFP